MNLYKLILKALIVLVLVGCGGGAVEPVSSPEAIQPKSQTPTSIPSEALASPTPIKGDVAHPSPTPGDGGTKVKGQKNDGPVIQEIVLETIYEFVGDGDGETGSFDVKSGDVVFINYTGGPITVYWVEPGNSLRQIYNGPSSNKGEYDTSVGDTGRFSINIKCDGDCEWVVAIESDGIPVAADTVVNQSPKKDESDNKDQTEQQNSDKTADVSNPVVLNPSIVKEEWDILSQSEASVILYAPDTRAINLDYNAGSRTASITGTKNAVPANANVMVANLELGTFVVTEASENGTFEAEIDGQPGTHILIKQDTTKQ